ncbi:MAG: hypothetical protein HUU01_01750 [Saprospiraceae bacterium]|nr:hypothetical protein [Saprospiraceae bacterium]
MKKNILTLIWCIMACVSFDVHAQGKLYCLIMADTNDPLVSRACYENERMIDSMMRSVASIVALDYRPTKLTGAKFTLNAVNDALKHINPSENDIMVVYYTGHAWIVSDKTCEEFNRILQLKDGKFELAKIELALAKKNAKFKLLLADCCSQLIRTKDAPQLVPSGTKGAETETRRKKNIQQLLSYREKVITAIASSCRHRGWCYENGGIFTRSFIRSFWETTERQNITWKVLLENAKDKTKYLAFIKHRAYQIPVYKTQ